MGFKSGSEKVSSQPCLSEEDTERVETKAAALTSDGLHASGSAATIQRSVISEFLQLCCSMC